MPFKRKPPPGSSRRPQHINGNIPATHVNKAGRTIPCESHLEYRAAIQLDHDPNVRDYIGQPEPIHFVDKHGKTRHYTADFLVWMVDGLTILLEITTKERFKQQPSRQERKEAAELVCEARGWQHWMWDESDLPNDTEFASLLSMYYFRAKSHANKQVLDAVYDRLESGQPSLLNPLIGSIAVELNLAPGIVMATICHMLWHGKLETDWQKLLLIDARPARNIRVWLPGNV